MNFIERTLLNAYIEEADKEGFAPLEVDYGDDEIVRTPTRTEMVEAVDAVDMATIRFRNKSGDHLWACFILGNGEDAISDYGVRPDGSSDRIFDAALEAVQ